MSDQPANDQQGDQIALPDNLWVLGHPFGDVSNRDSHKEYFDHRTKFFDEHLQTVPLSYYHNYTPDGKPMGEPVAIGVTAGRQYVNPDTGERDGRWDKAQFFDNVSLDIKERIAKAIEKGTLRASPTVVPDFHKVERDGHISHWLTGSIAIFDAEGMRQPANPRAIGLVQMKSLFKAANLEFPSQLEKKSEVTLKDLYSKLKKLLKAELRIDDDTNDNEVDGTPETWKDLLGEDEPDESETEDELNQDGEASPEQKKELETMADKANEQADSDLRLEFDKQQNEMKAMLAQNAELRQRLDRADIEKWIDGTVNAEGIKVTPAEREDVVALALTLKSSAHTMKAANGADTTAFEAFKKSIEERKVVVPLGDLRANEMKGGGKDDSKVSPERVNELLAKTSLGAQIAAEKNGKN